MEQEYGRTRSQTKKAREAASGTSSDAPTPSAPPTRLAGAFDDEADSAAGAAAVQRTPRRPRQQVQPRLTAADNNGNNIANAANAASGAAGGTGGRTRKTPARRQKSAARSGTAEEGRPTADSDEDGTNAADTPAIKTRGSANKFLHADEYENYLDYAMALNDPELLPPGQPSMTLAKAKKHARGRHADMTRCYEAIENKQERVNAMNNAQTAWSRYRKSGSSAREEARGIVEGYFEEVVATGGQLTSTQLYIANVLAEDGSEPAINVIHAENARRAAAAAAAAGQHANAYMHVGGFMMPAAGIGAPGAGPGAGIGAAGGIPAGGGGGGGAVAAGAAAAGGYGHGYAGGVGIGGGIGAGAGIMGNGAGAGAAIGGALNIIPPSPSAGGGVVGTPHAVGTPVQEFAQMMLEQRREDEERRMKFEAEQQERQRQFQMKMQAEQYQNQGELRQFQAQQEERQNAFQAQQQERQQAFEAGMQERQEERQNAFQAEQQERQNKFEAGMQERQNAFEAGMQDRQNEQNLVLERVLDRLDEQRQVGEKLQAQQAQTDKRIGDHIAKYEKDKEEFGVEVAGLIERLINLEKGSVEQKLLDAMLDGRKSQRQGAEEEQDGNEEEDAAFEITPASSEVADDTEISSIPYEDTKPAPREEILALMEQDLIEETYLNRDVATNLISEYAKDNGINRRLRKQKMWKKDKEFLFLSKLVLKAIPPYPFHEYFVYRCIKATPEHILWFRQQMANGKPITELAFTSACAFSPQQQLDRPELCNTFATMNTYIAIRSRSGRFVRKYVRSESYKKEWEVLFCYGTTFRILSFEDTRPGEKHEVGTPGRYRIVMEEVKSRIPGLKKAHTDEK